MQWLSGPGSACLEGGMDRAMWWCHVCVCMSVYKWNLCIHVHVYMLQGGSVEGELTDHQVLSAVL
jgi:hypothetical protein